MRQLGVISKLCAIANGPQALSARKAQETTCSQNYSNYRASAADALRKSPVTLAIFFEAEFFLFRLKN